MLDAFVSMCARVCARAVRASILACSWCVPLPFNQPAAGLLPYSLDAISSFCIPRWEAIFVSNMVVRLATFPFTVFTQKKSGRMTVSAAGSVEIGYIGRRKPRRHQQCLLTADLLAWG